MKYGLNRPSVAGLAAAVLFLSIVSYPGTARIHPYESPSLTTPASYPYRDPLLFVGQGDQHETLILNADDRIVGHVPTRTGLFATDLDGTFYVVPAHYTNEAMILAPPYKDAKVLNFGKYDTEAVAIDPKRGVFAITITSAGQSGGPSYAYFYRRGTTQPCATVQAPPGSSEFFGGAAFDREGRLFAPVDLNGDVGFASISGECKATTAEVNTFPGNQGLFASDKIQFDTNDDLVFGDVGNGQVFTFAHPVSGEFSASPLITTVLNIPPEKHDVPEFGCLTNDGAFLWADYGQNIAHTKYFAEFRYPQGGKAVKTLKLADAGACITTPPLLP